MKKKKQKNGGKTTNKCHCFRFVIIVISIHHYQNSFISSHTIITFTITNIPFVKYLLHIPFSYKFMSIIGLHTHLPDPPPLHLCVSPFYSICQIDDAFANPIWLHLLMCIIFRRRIIVQVQLLPRPSCGLWRNLSFIYWFRWYSWQFGRIFWKNAQTNCMCPFDKVIEFFDFWSSPT